VDDRFGLLEYRSELSQHVKELLDDVEKSSHVIEPWVAVLSALRQDGSGSLDVVFPSKSVVSGSRHDRFES
jgi:hypothetical protein